MAQKVGHMPFGQNVGRQRQQHDALDTEGTKTHPVAAGPEMTFPRHLKSAEGGQVESRDGSASLSRSHCQPTSFLQAEDTHSSAPRCSGHQKRETKSQTLRQDSLSLTPGFKTILFFQSQSHSFRPPAKRHDDCFPSEGPLPLCNLEPGGKCKTINPLRDFQTVQFARSAFTSQEDSALSPS